MDILITKSAYSDGHFRKCHASDALHQNTISQRFPYIYSLGVIFYLADEYSRHADKFHSEFMKRTNNSTGIVCSFH